MMDTGFFILANRERPQDPRTDQHVQALNILMESGARIHVAAPVLAEVLRKPYADPPPITTWPIVAFGRQQAELLGRHAGKKFTSTKGNESGYWKYDAMIAACAVASKCDALLVADHDYKSILVLIDLEKRIQILDAAAICSGPLFGGSTTK